MAAKCPCGSDRPYVACCGPYVEAEAIAPTAEAVMRSRYTAYATGQIDYLIRTHAPTTRTPGQRLQIRQAIATTDWLGLTVIKTQGGGKQAKTGTVEFVAWYRPKTTAFSSPAIASLPRSSPAAPSTPDLPAQLHERSRFMRQDGRWFYVDGDSLPPIELKRNSPCWCGSGKKLKHCHG